MQGAKTGAISYSIQELTEFVLSVFLRNGFNETQAHAVTQAIVAGERDDCKSHGIYRVEGVLRTAKAGKADAQAMPALAASESRGVVRVDARGGFANPAFELGLPTLAERAAELGVAALAINDCTHFSALWNEAEAVAGYGLAALAMCPSYATVAPTGGSRPLLGTNPLAFAWPRRGREPYVFDFATSVAARGEVELKRRAGEPLPQGWALDADGLPTTDPEQALAGAMLPFGGHKGSAIGTMIELLAGIMIGDLTSREALNYIGSTSFLPRHGELVLAFSPGAFSALRPGDSDARAEALFDAILGQGARLPSQRRFAARRRAETGGVTLTGAEVARLERLAEGGPA